MFFNDTFLEAQQALLSVITATKETISDPEKHMGRFTREDKVCLLVAYKPPLLTTLSYACSVEPIISGHPLLSGQLLKSQNFCQ